MPWFWFLAGCYFGGMITLIIVGPTSNHVGEVLEPYSHGFHSYYADNGTKGVITKIAFLTFYPAYLFLAWGAHKYRASQEREAAAAFGKTARKFA